ncbi:hypothetical protein P5V15_006517 [Pogonomyrmex californicus]
MPLTSLISTYLSTCLAAAPSITRQKRQTSANVAPPPSTTSIATRCAIPFATSHGEMPVGSRSISPSFCTSMEVLSPSNQ